MKKKGPKSVKLFGRWISAVALSLIVLLGTAAGVSADEADAKRILKAMSDFMGAQKSLSFEFDATLEVVTTEEQILALASSGTVTLNRPDKIRVTRAGGFADVEMSFDGQTLTLLGKNLNQYTQLEVPGSIDHLIDELRDTYQRPLPAADLLLSNSYDALMLNVVDIKDLGSGVIGGVECDFLAFRTDEARVGRPLTPVSVAGVGRRTVRRCAVGVYNCRLPAPQSLDSLVGQTSSEWIRFQRYIVLTSNQLKGAKDEHTGCNRI